MQVFQEYQRRLHSILVATVKVPQLPSFPQSLPKIPMPMGLSALRSISKPSLSHLPSFSHLSGMPAFRDLDSMSTFEDLPHLSAPPAAAGNFPSLPTLADLSRLPSFRDLEAMASFEDLEVGLGQPSGQAWQSARASVTAAREALHALLPVMNLPDWLGGRSGTAENKCAGAPWHKKLSAASDAVLAQAELEGLFVRCFPLPIFPLVEGYCTAVLDCIAPSSIIASCASVACRIQKGSRRCCAYLRHITAPCS
jgi:hypothetical protein